MNITVLYSTASLNQQMKFRDYNFDASLMSPVGKYVETCANILMTTVEMQDLQCATKMLRCKWKRVYPQVCPNFPKSTTVMKLLTYTGRG
jgi:hypothetical protein